MASVKSKVVKYLVGVIVCQVIGCCIFFGVYRRQHESDQVRANATTITPGTQIPRDKEKTLKGNKNNILPMEFLHLIHWRSLAQGDCKCCNGCSVCDPYPWQRANGGYNLNDDYKVYFFEVGKYRTRCLQEGTKVSMSINSCQCLEGWHGVHCSIPDVVMYSDMPKRCHPQIRRVPRRIIHAFPFLMDFSMFEARIHELGDLVDVFLILESNYTARGDPKPTMLLDRLKAGCYPKVACKIVHVFLDFFPDKALQKGWVEEVLMRNYLGTQGLTHQLGGIRHDDIFLLTDEDEIPNREVSLFLKLHDGYPEPFGFHLSWRIFGFYWKANTIGSILRHGGLTVGMLVEVFNRNANKIRGGGAKLLEEPEKVSQYIAGGALVSYWNFGNWSHPAGFLCTFCCESACIRNKLLSASRGAFPGWTSNKDKLELSYISGLIRRGSWFDDTLRLTPVNLTAHNYAPKYFMENIANYKDIIVKPYS